MEASSVSSYLELCLGDLPSIVGAGAHCYYRGINEIFPTPHIPNLYVPGTEYAQNEHVIFREVVSLFPDTFGKLKTTAEKLILMQHFRYPTRIMDVSRNPLTSLFFSCFSDMGLGDAGKKDGVVYRYVVPDADIQYCDSGRVSILANLAQCDADYPWSDVRNWTVKAFNGLDDENNWYGRSLTYFIREEHQGFYDIINPADLYSVAFLRPSMNSERIIRQDGFFFLFGINGNSKLQCARFPTEWVKEEIIIPARHKRAILNDLDAMGLNQGFYYTDMERMSYVIRERYKQ
jgi:hypothetical protein